MAACVATGINVGSIVTPSDSILGLSPLHRWSRSFVTRTSELHPGHSGFGGRTFGYDFEFHARYAAVAVVIIPGERR